MPALCQQSGCISSLPPQVVVEAVVVHRSNPELWRAFNLYNWVSGQPCLKPPHKGPFLNSASTQPSLCSWTPSLHSQMGVWFAKFCTPQEKKTGWPLRQRIRQNKASWMSGSKGENDHQLSPQGISDPAGACDQESVAAHIVRRNTQFGHHSSRTSLKRRGGGD